jgi:predicted MPP superfamily phosphohydrolase
MTHEGLDRRLPRGRKHGQLQQQILNGSGLLFGLGAGIASYAILHEPLNIGLERLSIHIPSAKGRLPAGGLRILHLSDTHFQGRDWRERAKIERIRRLTEGLEYDLLVHTGDFIHYDNGLPNLRLLLATLPAPRLGGYAVMGNHDYTQYDTYAAITRMWSTFQKREKLRRAGAPLAPLALPRHLARFGQFVRDTPLDGKRTGTNDVILLAETLNEWGIRILHNEAVHLNYAAGQPDGLDIYMAGVDDVTEGRPHIYHALDQVPAEAPTILLSHNPDIIISPRIDQVELILAGHTHGGQVVLPFWGPAHTQAEYVARSHVAGYLRKRNTQVYITRGIGEGIPIRLGAKPQFALITITA